MKLTIIIPTYNRSSILEKTLANFTQLDITGLDVDYIIIDNNSNDNTAEIIRSFNDKLNITYLFEKISGKNRAINNAIKSQVINDIVVFTDDDVNPASNWLQEISKACNNHPDISVFGGRILLEWTCPEPEWLKGFEKEFLCWGYALHDLGDKELYYSDKTFPHEPFGPNFWIRKHVLADGRLFNENVGPTASVKTRIMGSETEFLNRLQNDGFKILYYPNAIVKHFVTANQTTLKYFIKRSISAGGSRAVNKPFKAPGLYNINKPLWYLSRYILKCLFTSKLFLLTLTLNRTKRYKAILKLYNRIGYDRCYIHNTDLVWQLTNNKGHNQ